MKENSEKLTIKGLIKNYQVYFVINKDLESNNDLNQEKRENLIEIAKYFIKAVEAFFEGEDLKFYKERMLNPIIKDLESGNKICIGQLSQIGRLFHKIITERMVLKIADGQGEYLCALIDGEIQTYEIEEEDYTEDFKDLLMNYRRNLIRITKDKNRNEVVQRLLINSSEEEIFKDEAIKLWYSDCKPSEAFIKAAASGFRRPNHAFGVVEGLGVATVLGLSTAIPTYLASKFTGVNLVNYSKAATETLVNLAKSPMSAPIMQNSLESIMLPGLIALSSSAILSGLGFYMHNKFKAMDKEFGYERWDTIAYNSIKCASYIVMLGAIATPVIGLVFFPMSATNLALLSLAVGVSNYIAVDIVYHMKIDNKIILSYPKDKTKSPCSNSEPQTLVTH
jgi:hypothetical protein